MHLLTYKIISLERCNVRTRILQVVKIRPPSVWNADLDPDVNGTDSVIGRFSYGHNNERKLYAKYINGTK